MAALLAAVEFVQASEGRWILSDGCLGRRAPCACVSESECLRQGPSRVPVQGYVGGWPALKYVV